VPGSKEVNDDDCERISSRGEEEREESPGMRGRLVVRLAG
jgi:hypothetical protein